MRCCTTCRLLGSSPRCPACAGTTALPDELLEPPRMAVKVGTRPKMWTAGRTVVASVVFVAVLCVALEVASDWIISQPRRVAEETVEWIALGILGLALLVAGAMITLRLYRRRRDGPRSMSAVRVDADVFAAPSGATEIVGVAREHRSSCAALDGGVPCLASAIHAQRGARVVAWYRESVDFLIERDGAAPVLVTGELILDVPAKIHSVDASGIRSRLPIGEQWNLDASLESRRLDAGTRVGVVGTLTHQVRPDLVSSYRDATSLLIEGRPGAVARVFVLED